MSHSSLCTQGSAGNARPSAYAARQRRLEVCIALALAVVMPVASARGDASAWQRAMSDPRMRTIGMLPLQERYAIAREDGLQRFLPPARGTSIPVNNCADAGPGSLRDAVAAAASEDTVDASGLTCGTITLSTGQIAIGVDDLNILGPGKTALTIQNGGGTKYLNRIFAHTGSGNLAIIGMTLNGGSIASGTADAKGGCVYSANGSVTLGNPLFVDDVSSGVVISGCRAVTTADHTSSRGGGVYAGYSFSMTNSVISGCSASNSGEEASSRGGGVNQGSGDGVQGFFSMKYSEIRDNTAVGQHGYGGGVESTATAGHDITITGSTLSGNSSSVQGGALYATNFGGTIALHDSTISGNTARAWAGLVLIAEDTSMPSAIEITSSTITANVGTGAASPTFGGTGLRASGAVDLQSTIIAGNTLGGVADDVAIAGPSPTGADNLIGVFTGSVPQNGLIISSDPHLGPLASNGGRTRTHALLAGSQAIDRGNNSGGEDNDQRGPGYPRNVGVSSDIGAYEYDPERIFHDGFDKR